MPFFVKFRVKSVLFTLVVIFCLMFMHIYAINNVADCGKRKLPYQSTITHGAATDISRWPWHASIYHKLNNVSSYACGGTIVDKNTILTAAHCLFVTNQPLPADRVSVHVGRDHLNTTSGSVQVLEAVELLIYPEFRKHNVAHDIAIVKLSSNIEMTDFVQPACLRAEDEAQHHIIGKQGTILGFGKTENDPVSEYLQETNLTVVEGLKCLVDARDSVSQVLTSSMFCSRAQPGVSTFSADSGGGMFFERNNTWYVRGIVSFSPSPLHDGSCENANSTVFTDVNNYRYWIMNFINLNAIDNGIDRDFLLISVGDDEQWTVELSNRTNYDRHRGYGSSCVFDCKEGRIYGIENRGVIFSVDHNGKDRKEFLRSEDTISCLAVDWIGRRLYWHSLSKSTIEVASLDDPYKRAVLISQSGYVENMVVDPHRGKLYWLGSSYIAENLLNLSNLDGTNRKTLIDYPNFFLKSTIKLLIQTGELCYPFFILGEIKCIDVHRQKDRIIGTTSFNAVGLVVTDSLIYWMDESWIESVPSIESVNMKGERQPSIALPQYIRLSDFTLVTGKCTHSYNPCVINNGDCSENTICLFNPEAPGGKNCTALSNES